MSLTFADLFVNPSAGDLTFTSTLTAELGDVDVQGFVFNILFIDGCTDPLACNYNADAGNDDGSCVFCVEGCSNACGCMDSSACNYNSEATIDDGSCEFVSCIEFGCMDETACNFNPAAVLDVGSCVYANAPYDCNGECLDDSDEDGVCDVNETFGCTDEGACNFSLEETEDDVSCTYINPAYECDCDGNVLDECGVCGGNGIAEGDCD